jgi:hypothetical protein
MSYFTGDTMDRKNVKALMTGILNNDDAEILRIVDACFEAEYGRQLERATRAVFESVGTGKKPVIG